MPETIKSLTQHLTDMPVNTTGLISTQDIRDFLWSVMGVVPFAAKSANYTLTDDDVFIEGTGGGGGITITLPAHSSARAGKFYIINKVDGGAGAVTVARAGSDTINGATSKAVSTQYGAILIVRGASEWRAFTLTGA